jgi:tripartite ATP-independent transporter DctM subunit
MVFAGISGAAAADCAALGPIEIRSMTDNGYDLKYSTGITLASSMVGPIIPPSVFFILFGVVTNTSIARLFLAGILPGVAITIALMLMCARIAVRRPDIFPRGQYTPMRERWNIFKKAVWSLLAPVIIVFGMTSGVVSPTEAGVVAVLYSILLGVIYRTLKWKALWHAVRESMVMASSSLILFGFASTMSYILTMEMLPNKLAALILSLTQNKFVVLILIDLLLLLLGCFMSAASAMILLTPILLPLMAQLGVSTLQLGVLMCFALTIGIATPPVGMGLYILADITHQKIEEVVQGFMPFFPALLIMLVLLTLVPQISVWLPGVLMP